MVLLLILYHVLSVYHYFLFELSRCHNTDLLKFALVRTQVWLNNLFQCKKLVQ